MSQGLLPYRVEVGADDAAVTGRAGLPLVLETMRAVGLDRAIAQHVHLRARQSGYTEAEKIEARVLLLAAGGDCFDDIAVLQADSGRRRLLGRRLPSADTLRHCLYACHDEERILAAQAARPAGQVAYIPAETAVLQGLAHVNTALVHRVAARGKSTTATLDHDAPIQESHKREALPHDKGGRGYQPTAVYWGEQDLVVADEVPGRERGRGDGDAAAHPAGLRQPAGHSDHLVLPCRHGVLRRTDAAVAGRSRKARRPRGPHRLHHRRRHDEGLARGLRRRR